MTLPDPLEYRKADYPIEPLILRRWSPRAMSGETIGLDDLMSLFEAARWAPSSFNEQEWRFLYALNGSDHWSTFLGLLMEANQLWCKRAAVLVVVVSATRFSHNDKPNRVHSFDTGAAFENLALQGTAMGLVVHPMAGFDHERARSELEIPDRFHVEAMVAIGKPGDPALLPEPLREKEIPSGRRPVADSVFSGKWGGAAPGQERA